ncbi:MAG: hypothetical protein FJY98_02355 [Candidatus Liptonbacteria bacterium]|nr:hypothetical protein [Candidatus Liptonbacteria bacterium]
MKSPRTILFDFYGVLCRGKFYNEKLREKFPHIFDWIQENIFGGTWQLADEWMRGKLKARDINKHIAEGTGIEEKLLNELFFEDLKKLPLEERMLAYAKELKQQGKKICIVSDNMDVFSEITVPQHQLNKAFDVVINSADYGLLKQDEKGKLFDIALEAIGEKDISLTLLIDDSPKSVEVYKEKGGNIYL